MTGFEPSYPEKDIPDMVVEALLAPIGGEPRYCYYCQRRILPGDFMRIISGGDIVHSECRPMYEKLLERVAEKVYKELLKTQKGFELFPHWKLKQYNELDDKSKESHRKTAKEYLDIIFKKELS